MELPLGLGAPQAAEPQLKAYAAAAAAASVQASVLASEAVSAVQPMLRYW